MSKIIDSALSTLSTRSPEEFLTLMPNVWEGYLNVKAQLDRDKNVILTAPVKSGKRMLVQLIAIMSMMRNACGKMTQKCRHLFVTSLVKRDTGPQMDEMKLCGIEVFRLLERKYVEQLCRMVDTEVSEGRPVYVHFDESDIGTEKKQLFDAFFTGRNNNPNIKMVCYSATNYEAVYSNSNLTNGGNFAEVRMRPGPGYRGAEWFLQNGLVHQSTQFFTWDATPVLTPQGEHCVKSLLSPSEDGRGKVGVVRLADPESFNRLKKDWNGVLSLLYGFGKNVQATVVDQKSPYNWGENGPWKVEVENGKNVVIFVHQTCTRSTELGFHAHMPFFHDHREPNSSNLATIAQSSLRVAHYHPTGHKIELFTNREAIELHASIHSETPSANPNVIKMPLSCRTNKPRSVETYAYEFWDEQDPSIIMVGKSGKKVKNPKNCRWIRFRDGKKVPAPYNSEGQRNFSFARYSKQGSRGGKRSLIEPIGQSKPRSFNDPLVCIDRMPANQKDSKILRQLKTKRGRSVHQLLLNGKTVFGMAIPLGTTTISKTRKNSVYSA